MAAIPFTEDAAPHAAHHPKRMARRFPSPALCTRGWLARARQVPPMRRHSRGSPPTGIKGTIPGGKPCGAAALPATDGARPDVAQRGSEALRGKREEGSGKREGVRNAQSQRAQREPWEAARPSRRESVAAFLVLSERRLAFFLRTQGQSPTPPALLANGLTNESVPNCCAQENTEAASANAIPVSSRRQQPLSPSRPLQKRGNEDKNAPLPPLPAFGCWSRWVARPPM